MARSDKVSTLEEAKAQFETRLAAMAGVGGAAGNVVAPCIPLLITELRSRLKAAPLEANEFFSQCGCGSKALLHNVNPIFLA
jgi:hypothetical protein